jgi:selenide,water dikinase
LAQVLCHIDIPHDKNLLVGLDTNDDAVAYKVDEDKAVIETVDFFTPIVDDPYDFGQIAAANALSDVYAMGGKPVFALNIVCFPVEYLDILKDIIRGGNDKVKEASAFIAGGHSVEDKEPKYGLCVTGIVHPDKVITNSNAKPGDILILTKPIGCGVINTAFKGEMCPEDVFSYTVEVMKYLNKDAAEIMVDVGVNSCTDITGFGLMGHSYEMAHGSNVSIVFNIDAIPIIEGAKEIAAMGFIPAGAYRNKNYLKNKFFIKNADDAISDLLFDPQTSGGLLISVDKNKAQELYERLNKRLKFGCKIVGEVVKKGKYDIYVK